MFQRMATMRDYGKMTPLQAAGCVRERRRDLKESRRLTDTPGSLRKCIRTFRYSLYDGAGRPRPMIGVLEELGVRDAFDVRATRETADCLANHIAKEYAAYHRIEIELVREMFCVVIFGLVGLVKMNPQIEDDVLMKVIEQTLRLDMAPIGKGEG